jgi:hypothetical protein
MVQLHFKDPHLHAPKSAMRTDTLLPVKVSSMKGPNFARHSDSSATGIAITSERCHHTRLAHSTSTPSAFIESPLWTPLWALSTGCLSTLFKKKYTSFRRNFDLKKEKNRFSFQEKKLCAVANHLF